MGQEVNRVESIGTGGRWSGIEDWLVPSKADPNGQKRCIKKIGLHGKVHEAKPQWKLVVR